jgi:hypothetical protein
MVGERGPRWVSDRLREHSLTKDWWPDVTRIDVAECIGLIEVRVEEQRQITVLWPEHNQRGKSAIVPLRRPEVQRHPVAEQPSEDDWWLEVEQCRIERGLDPYTGIPIAWPHGMWARVWAEATFGDDAMEVVGSIFCREDGPLTGYQVQRTESEPSWHDPCWVQPDNPKAFGGALRVKSPWSAHSWLVTNDGHVKFTPWHQQVQQTFLNALLSRGRCMKVQSGIRAAAWGFGSKDEAQCAGTALCKIFSGMAHYARDAQLATAAILAAPTPRNGYGCPACQRICVDDGSRELYCWRCRLPMISLESHAEPRSSVRGAKRVYDFPVQESP